MGIYDVFICCKSEDYHLAWDVYTFLVEKGIRVFLADAELRKKGNSEYGKVIDEALESVQHLILIASKNKYILSSYVESEWRTFLEEKRCGRKNGNLLTILNGINLSELPISLRNQQSFLYEDFRDVINFLPSNGKKGEFKHIQNESFVHFNKKSIFKIKGKSKYLIIYLLLIVVGGVMLIHYFPSGVFNHEETIDDAKEHVTSNVFFLDSVDVYQRREKIAISSNANTKQDILKAIKRNYKKENLSISQFIQKLDPIIYKDVSKDEVLEELTRF